MQKLDRREFMRKTAVAVGATFGGPLVVHGQTAGTCPASATRPVAEKLKRVNDVVALGKTGLRTSRLAIGTGTMGGREQRALGVEGLVKLFHHGLDQGVRWWETADMYKTHPHVQAALKEIKRDRVIIATKTRSRDAAGVTADIERFRTEMGVDYIDIVLLHCLIDQDWREKMRGPMDALSKAKEQGRVRAVGCSFHDFAALSEAAEEPWVDVVLARINPFAARMDVDKAEDVPKVERVLATMHERGKVIYGMKILGEGGLKGDQIDTSLRFAVTRPYLAGFTIGFGKPEQIDDIARRVERAQEAA